MSTLATPPAIDAAVASFSRLPDHTQLPDSDGAVVENYAEHPQSILLTTSITPHLLKRHPNGHFAIGQDSGIYFRPTDPPLRGCKSPDWYYVPDVAPMPEGEIRRSYVLWYELIPPTLLIEFVSGDGSEERDQTPMTGKFWVYERVIRPAYYAIWEPELNRLEVRRLIATRFEPVLPNERGHFSIAEMGIELGLWRATYMGHTLPWLRFYDTEGQLLPTAEEREEQNRLQLAEERTRSEMERQRAEVERQRAETERQRADEAQQRAERLAARLRALGEEPS